MQPLWVLTHSGGPIDKIAVVRAFVTFNLYKAGYFPVSVFQQLFHTIPSTKPPAITSIIDEISVSNPFFVSSVMV